MVAAVLSIVSAVLRQAWPVVARAAVVGSRTAAVAGADALSRAELS